MPLVTLREILREAVPQRYAVGSFNAANHSMVEAILNAAEQKSVPVILSVAEAHFRYFNLDHFISYIHDRVAKTSVPVCLHLDHGLSIETIKRGIDLGFSSVMIDASILPYDENVATTAEVVNLAKPHGISVEAELGHVAGGEGNLSEGTEVDSSKYTNPEQAADFVKSTGIDALAIAIGTVHGPYKGKPHLDLDILQKIRSLLPIPLVLHGGSGLSAEDFRSAIEHGINKVNFFTESSLAAVDQIKQVLSAGVPVNYPDLTIAAEQRVTELIGKQIEIFGTQPLEQRKGLV